MDFFGPGLTSVTRRSPGTPSSLPIRSTDPTGSVGGVWGRICHLKDPNLFSTLDVPTLPSS